MQIVGIDERDSSWECSNPRFRVYLHGSGKALTHGWTDTYDITGADVLQVIDWAQKQARDSLTYAIALVWDDLRHEEINPGHGRGLIWLIGEDGNSSSTDERAVDALRRMLARRTDPVLVPRVDRMPAGVPDPYNDGTEARPPSTR